MDTGSYLAVIKVVGIGGGGTNAVNRMVDHGLKGGVVTKPFDLEGTQRLRQAVEGFDRLREQVDTMIVIPNEKLLAAVERLTSILDAFREADAVLGQGVQGITDLI